MGKGWSILFGGTMIACAGLFIVSPLVGWWMAPGYSTHAANVDRLFYVILAITGFFFILTEGLLVFFMFKFAGRPGPQPPAPTGPSRLGNWFKPITNVIHDQHRLEIAWTVVPAAILLYIAFAQVGTWADIKYEKNKPAFKDQPPVQVEISARQFEWRMRYPSSSRVKDWLASNQKEEADFNAFPRNPHQDDVHTVNTLHVIQNRPALIHLKTRDVLHSLNIPHMRVKQDALSGKTIPVWFTPTTYNTRRVGDHWEDGFNPHTGQGSDNNYVWEIPCAELCGWGHYRMIGRLYVHKDPTDYLEWLRHAEKHEHGVATAAKGANK